MNKEAALIVGVIMAVLSLLNITLTPADAEAVQTIVEFFIIAGGTAAIRQFVFSRKSFFSKNG
jgi:hypothetical protein